LRKIFQIFNVRFLVLLLLSSLNVSAAIIVSQDTGSKYKNIQEAINIASPSSTIHIKPGVYNENLVISKPTSLIGDDSDTSCILIISKSQFPAILIKSSNVSIKKVRLKNSDISGGICVVLDGATNCVLRDNWLGYLGSFSSPVIIKNGSTANMIVGNYMSGTSNTIGIIISSSKNNSFTNNILDYGWEVFGFINYTKGDNTFSKNHLQNKNMSGRLKDDTTTNSYSLKMTIPSLNGKSFEKSINPSGWEDQGKFIYREIWNFCSTSSNTNVQRYWEIIYGGSNDSTYSIVRSQDKLDSIWSKLRLKPQKPKINFTNSCLIVIQPGETITQYNYKILFNEDPNSINITLNEFHTSKAAGFLGSQEPILAYEIPATNKPIRININRCPGSKGPYPK
jgi:hypothetical protein